MAGAVRSQSLPCRDAPRATGEPRGTSGQAEISRADVDRPLRGFVNRPHQPGRGLAANAIKLRGGIGRSEIKDDLAGFKRGAVTRNGRAVVIADVERRHVERGLRLNRSERGELRKLRLPIRNYEWSHSHG